jgi:hypothetical protein
MAFAAFVPANSKHFVQYAIECYPFVATYVRHHLNDSLWPHLKVRERLGWIVRYLVVDGRVVFDDAFA